MKILTRIFFLGLVSLASGILVNSFLNEGIPWRLLVPLKTDWISKTRISYFDVETAVAVSKKETVVFMDIRPKSGFRMDHIPGAKNMPFVEFFRRPSLFALPDKKTMVIVYDFESGSKKARVFARYLAQSGFLQVNMLYPGFSGWMEFGGAVEKGNSP